MAHVIRMDQGLRLDTGLRFDQMVPDATGPMKGTKHMSGEMIPVARPSYGDWLLNAKEQSAIQGPLIGASPESVTALQAAWVKIGTDTSSPYIDGRPLAVPGVAEMREYMLRGCDRDEKEIGLESDIVSILYKG